MWRLTFDHGGDSMQNANIQIHPATYALDHTCRSLDLFLSLNSCSLVLTVVYAVCVLATHETFAESRILFCIAIVAVVVSCLVVVMIWLHDFGLRV